MRPIGDIRAHAPSAAPSGGEEGNLIVYFCFAAVIIFLALSLVLDFGSYHVIRQSMDDKLELARAQVADAGFMMRFKNLDPANRGGASGAAQRTEPGLYLAQAVVGSLRENGVSGEVHVYVAETKKAVHSTKRGIAYAATVSTDYDMPVRLLGLGSNVTVAAGAADHLVPYTEQLAFRPYEASATPADAAHPDAKATPTAAGAGSIDSWYGTYVARAGSPVVEKKSNASNLGSTPNTGFPGVDEMLGRQMRLAESEASDAKAGR